ncbi:MASE1 domain-containing protein, partial [Escherichia coli]|uniref:MASE1 domain-containing protein n=1 Tax=Escherichia coli TaxID=562 RepID=UPI002247A26A
NATYIKIRDKWWGLPLFLPSLILPIFAHINTFAHISSGEVFLFYLPLALMISMMMFFSWAALPGIALGIFVRKYAELGFYETLSLTAKEGANKRGNSSRLTQSFHFFMFEPIFSPVNALN